MKLIIKWLICFGALIAGAYCFPEYFTVEGGGAALALAATVLWLANLILRPILQVISLPVTLLSFGLFSLVVNAGMVGLTDAIMPSIKIHSFWLCLFVAVVVSAGNWALITSGKKS